MNDLKPMKKLLFRVAAEVSNEAKDLAPFKSGNLKKDIQVFDDDIDDGEIRVGNSKLAPYAPFVHQGTGKQARGRSRAPNKKGQKAQPYLEDALNSYVNDGSLDRALNDPGKDIASHFKDQLKDSLKNVTIK